MDEDILAKAKTKARGDNYGRNTTSNSAQDGRRDEA
jgi:hypothetical protein